MFRRIQDLLTSEPGTLIKADAAFTSMRQASGFHHEGRAYPVALQPFVLESEWADTAKVASEGLHRVLERVADLYLEDEAVRRFFANYRHAERWLTAPQRVRPCAGVCRLDGVFINGSYRIMETNTCCPGGVIKVGAQFSLWQSVMADILKIEPPDAGGQPFVTDPMLFVKHLIKMHQLQFGRLPTGAAVISLNGRYMNEVDLTVKGLLQFGIPARHLDAKELRRAGCGKVLGKGFEVTLAYHKLDQLELITTSECFEYLDAGAAGEVCFLNHLLSQCVLEDKSVLALISDPRFAGRFTVDDQEIIKRHVPWTRVLATGKTTDPEGALINLCEYVINHRKQLVVKSCNLTRGEDITIGAFVGKDHWDALVSKAIHTGNHVVQQYLPLPKMPVIIGTPPQFVDMVYELDTYLINGMFAGFLCRASLDPVVNVGRSGIMVPVLITPALGRVLDSPCVRKG